MHSIHIGRERINNIIAVKIKGEPSLSDLPEMGDLERIPAIRFRLICNFCVIFLSCDHKQVNLFLVPVVEILQIFRHIETLIIGNRTISIKFVFELGVEGVLLVTCVLIMVDCPKFVLHSCLVLMIVFFVNY